MIQLVVIGFAVSALPLACWYKEFILFYFYLLAMGRGISWLQSPWNSGMYVVVKLFTANCCPAPDSSWCHCGRIVSHGHIRRSQCCLRQFCLLLMIVIGEQLIKNGAILHGAVIIQLMFIKILMESLCQLMHE